MSRGDHPAAGLFPLMGEAELAALAADIRANGLRVPILVDGNGQVLDGRNRLAACEIAGVEPTFEAANGDDPLALVVSLNVKRRNLNAGQRAVAAAEAWDLASQELGRGKGRAQTLGELFDVSHAYVTQARALLRDAPELAARVKTGEVALAAAYDALRDRDRREEEARMAAATAEERAAELREDMECLRAELDGLDLLPAPDPEEYAGPGIELKLEMDEQRSKHRSVDDEDLKWMAALRALNDSARDVTELAKRTPPGQLNEWVAIGARDVARRLGDTSAHLLRAFPADKSAALRRVK